MAEPQFRSAFTRHSRKPVCSITGWEAGKDENGNDLPVIALAEIDHEGSFDICWAAAEMVGRLVGMVPQSEADEIRATGEAADVLLQEALAELAAVRGALAGAREEAKFHEAREANALTEGYNLGYAAGRTARDEAEAGS